MQLVKKYVSGIFYLELENVYDGKRSLEIAGKLNIK
jgi:hypothetical protein